MPASIEKKTMVQQLSDLVEWFISDRGVELRFRPITSKSKPGKIVPEFDFEYWMDGRRIVDKTLAMLIMVELARRNYAFNLARIIATLVEHSWRYYVANQDYPQWMALEAKPVMKRPNGRPRTKPKLIPFDELTAGPVNTSLIDQSDRGLPDKVNIRTEDEEILARAHANQK